MDKKYRDLRIRQLDEQFSRIKKLNQLQVPDRGWIWEIRNALGMTHSQIAKRLKISAPAVVSYERGEMQGTISLNTLKKTAGALNCRLIYAIVPDITLKNMLDTQTLKAAKKILKRVNHSMNLEEQGVRKKENLKQLKELLEDVNKEIGRDIWDEI